MKTDCVIHWIEINPPFEQLKAGAHFWKSRKLLSPERSVFQNLWNYDLRLDFRRLPGLGMSVGSFSRTEAGNRAYYDLYFFSWGRIRQLVIGFMDFDSPKMLKKKTNKNRQANNIIINNNNALPKIIYLRTSY